MGRRRDRRAWDKHRGAPSRGLRQRGLHYGRVHHHRGTRLEKRASAAAGDFIYIPARLVHQEINESDSVPVSSIVVRSGDNVVENVVTSDQLADAERGR